MECKMCNLDYKKEKVYYEDKDIAVLDTIDNKGHNDRIMVVVKNHSKTPNATTKHKAVSKLIETGKKVFPKDFALMSDKYSRLPNHWHMLASDFDGWDFEQILETPMQLVRSDKK